MQGSPLEWSSDTGQISDCVCAVEQNSHSHFLHELAMVVWGLAKQNPHLKIRRIGVFSLLKSDQQWT